MRLGTLALAVFVIVVTFVFHANFADQIQIALFTKNAAILGGLLYMNAFGAGKFSPDTKQMTNI